MPETKLTSEPYRARQHDRGCFITVEGVEGVGKTTNMSLISEVLAAHDIPYITSREPGGTELSEKIRDLVLDKNTTDMKAMTELSLVFAARIQHVEALIKPALAAGTWVVCDRFTDSTFAYQGAGRELGESLVTQFENLILSGFKPDLTFLLDLDVKIGLARAAKRSDLDRIEQEESAFFERVRAGFLRRSEQDDRFCLIDASKPLEAVQNDVRQYLNEWVTQW